MNATSRMASNCLQLALGGLDWVARRRGRVEDLPPHLLVGIQGEDAAWFFLQRKGYVVVARRWSSGNLPGDLDLVAWKGPLLCFIEVKTRTAHDMNPAQSAVDSEKRRTLRRLARQYVRQLPDATAPPVRFDVISVYLIANRKPEFEHFEGAFGWSEWRPRDDWE
jgi:putative endonuclease